VRIVNFSSALSILLVLGCSGMSHPLPTDAAAPVADAAMTVDAGASVDAAASIDAAVEPDAAQDPDAEVAPDAGPAPSFDSIYEDILVPRCGRCHIAEYIAPYRPRLPDVDTAYEALFEVPAVTSWVQHCVPDAYRVRPFDLDSSMLAFLPTCYVRDADHGSLTSEELAQIRAWISAGAPREPF
jgi:hypothetical protein